MACSSDDSGQAPTGGDDAGPTADASVDATRPDSSTGGGDSSTGGNDSSTGNDASTSGNDAGSGEDASSGGGDAGDSGPSGSNDGGTDAADAAAPAFCASQSGLAFCADFDEPAGLDLDAGDLLGWTLSAGNTDFSISTAQSVSPPSSFAVSIANPPDTLQSVKLVKMVTPAAGVTQAIYEFDVYLSSSATGGDNPGGFLCDFQFADQGGNTDLFGFRIGIFGNATGFDHADFEHNSQIINNLDSTAVNPIPFTAGAWQHIKMAAAFSAAPEDAGTQEAGALGQVSFQLYLNNSATPEVDATYAAPASKADFARIAAGMVYAFSGTEKTWGLYYDNITLKLQ